MFSVVKMMKEQGNQFDWSQIAIDIPSMPCFKPEAKWSEAIEEQSVLALLNDGYTALDFETGTPIEGGWSGEIVHVTGDDPHVDLGTGEYIDCEPAISVIPNELSALTPIGMLNYIQEGIEVGSIARVDDLWGMARDMAGNGVYIIYVHEHPELPARLVSDFTVIGYQQCRS